MTSRSYANIAFAIALFALTTNTPAHAYLDGGTVSMVLQAATGAVASILLFGKVFWAKLKGFFSRSGDNQLD